MAEVKYMSLPAHTGDPRDDLLINSLLRFFSVTSNVMQIIRFLSPESRVTRSLLDWFVTNYVKESPVEYTYKGRHIDVRAEYKEQLKRYKKRRSDPFCRGHEKFTIKTGVAECPTIETSARQLCFFRWAIQCNVLEYVESHYDEVNSYYENRNRKAHRKRTHRASKSQSAKDSTRRRWSAAPGKTNVNAENELGSKNDQRIVITYYSEPLRVRF